MNFLLQNYALAIFREYLNKPEISDSQVYISFLTLNTAVSYGTV